MNRENVDVYAVFLQGLLRGHLVHMDHMECSVNYYVSPVHFTG